jgi:hypothetical protein
VIFEINVREVARVLFVQDPNSRTASADVISDACFFTWIRNLDQEPSKIHNLTFRDDRHMGTLVLLIQRLGCTTRP